MTKIDIVSGFLGAGKTTLIKKLLAEAYQGEKLVLIENEFGEISIDGGFLKDSGVQISEMSSGCICCSLVGDFGKALQDVHQQFHPDRILIEPSGVGKLSDVITAVQNTIALDPEAGAEQLCHRGRCRQGKGIYEKLRRVLQQSGGKCRNHHPFPDAEAVSGEAGIRRGHAA